MTLVEFLLDRIAEDQGEADRARHSDDVEDYDNNQGQTAEGNFHDSGCYYYSNSLDPARCDCDGWKRRLAECEFRRRVVALHSQVEDRTWMSGSPDYLWCRSCGTLDDHPIKYPCETLRLVGLPYADHPDYQEKWRP